MQFLRDQRATCRERTRVCWQNDNHALALINGSPFRDTTRGGSTMESTPHSSSIGSTTSRSSAGRGQFSTGTMPLPERSTSSPRARTAACVTSTRWGAHTGCRHAPRLGGTSRMHRGLRQGDLYSTRGSVPLPNVGGPSGAADPRIGLGALWRRQRTCIHTVPKRLARPSILRWLHRGLLA